MLATYLEFGADDEALALTEEWIAAAPEDAAWARAKLRVLLAAGRAKDAVAFARERLRAPDARVAQLREQMRELTTPRSPGSAPAEIEARAQGVERDLGAALADQLARRAEFVQVCLDGREALDAAPVVRQWLVEQPESPQVREWLIELLLAADAGEDAARVLSEYVPKSRRR